MNMIKKTMISALLALSALGLTTSLPALADSASDAALYCVGCHDGLTVNGAAVGGGARSCAQRSVAEWTSTIDRMNAKGCGVPAGSISGIANYLNGLFSITCYRADGSSFIFSGSGGVSPLCPLGSGYYPPPACPDGVVTATDSRGWLCTPTTTSSSTTSTSSSTTVISTTTTTVCPPYLFYAVPNSLSFTVTQGGALPASQSLSLNFGSTNEIPQWSISSAPAWLSVTPTSGTGSGVLTVSIPTTQIDAGVYTGLIRFSSSTPGCPGGASNFATVNFTVEPAVTTSTSTTIPTVTSTTTTTAALTCYKPSADGLSYTTEVSYNTWCPSGTAYTPPPPCPNGTLSIVLDHQWQCTVATSSTTSTTTTTVATTTTTTLCNTYVNGTTQYPYSGSGSCHGHSDDGTTTGHVVRDQKWCRKHMTHFNSSGNHTHAYPHPACM